MNQNIRFQQINESAEPKQARANEKTQWPPAEKNDHREKENNMEEAQEYAAAVREAEEILRGTGQQAPSCKPNFPTPETEADRLRRMIDFCKERSWHAQAAHLERQLRKVVEQEKQLLLDMKADSFLKLCMAFGCKARPFATINPSRPTLVEGRSGASVWALSGLETFLEPIPLEGLSLAIALEDAAEAEGIKPDSWIVAKEHPLHVHRVVDPVLCARFGSRLAEVFRWA